MTSSKGEEVGSRLGDFVGIAVLGEAGEQRQTGATYHLFRIKTKKTLHTTCVIEQTKEQTKQKYHSHVVGIVDGSLIGILVRPTGALGDLEGGDVERLCGARFQDKRNGMWD